MAKEPPDPRSFNSWEEAFEYPIPIVRKFEQQLRNHAIENREKLRSLVGASYRDLLETAGRIIEMDKSMQQLDSTLIQVGQKCNSRALERMMSNFSRLEESRIAQERNRYSLAAQLAVLQSCPSVILRILKKRSSPLVAAKVLVISRLIHKQLSQFLDVPPYVNKLRNKLASLSRKLLEYIDNQLSSPTTKVPDLVENMCALSLATSSTPTDVLKHFHRVRLDAIARYFEEGEDVQGQVLPALKLCIKTLHDTQAIFPKRLTESLVKLKSQPLLQDGDVRSIIELTLDVNERWIAHEVRNFTPWPRHDELQRSQAEMILKSWAKQGLESFFNNTKSVLSGIDDLKTAVQLRHDMLKTWLSSSGRVPGVDSGEILDQFRDVINLQLSNLIRDHTSSLQLVTTEISNTLEDWQAGVSDQTLSLWDPSISSLSLANGAVTFKQSVLDRSHGRSEHVSRVITIYESWSQAIGRIQIRIKEMKEERWDDDLFDDTDEDFDLDSKQVLLAEDDPRSLSDALGSALSSALEKMGKDLQDMITDIVLTPHESASEKCAFTHRILRELIQRLSRLEVSSSNIRSLATLSNLTQSPQRMLITAILDPVLTKYKANLKRTINNTGALARALWEGAPPLPVQPSPTTFKLLHQISKDMASYGGDLWSPRSVRIMKEQICEVLQIHIEEHVDALRGITTDPADSIGVGLDKPQPSQVCKEKLIQLLYDILYLQRAFASAAETHPLDVTLDALQRAAGVDNTIADRLKKSVNDYWKRTYLLFAPLG